MLKRYALSGSLAIVVTVALFFLMQFLIAMGEAAIDESKRRKVIDFVRAKQESQTQTKKRELPEKQQLEDQPPQPMMDMPTTDGPSAQAINIGAPPVDTSIDLAGGPNLAGAPSDTSIIPLVRVNPIYPRGAAQRKIEGWVVVQFTISVTGTVKDPRVIAAEPVGVFERAALNAIRRWKYKPQIENGQPVEKPGERVRLTFQLSSNGN